MQSIEYGKEILEFPDHMSGDEIAEAIRELPEEKVLVPSEKVLPSIEKYRAGITLERINPTVAKEVRRIALERKHGYIATDPPSFKNFVKNIDIPEYTEELVNSFSSIIAGTALFTYRFGRNIMQDGNEAMREKGHPILPGMGPRVQEQVKPVSDLVQAIYYDWKAMFAGEVSDEISKLPLGEYRDALFEKIERQGLGDTLKYAIQDNPLDALLIGFCLKDIAGKGVKLSLTQVQKAVPKGTRIAQSLDSVLSTKRTPIIYNLGPEKNLAKVSAKVQKDTLKMLKPTSDIGGLTLDELASLAAIDPIKAVRHVRRSRVPYKDIVEGLRNKGMKVVVAAPKAERATVAKNLQTAVDRIDKITVKGLHKTSTVSKQVNLARKTGGSTFSASRGNLVGSNNYAVSIFPDHTKVVSGKVTNKQLSKFYLDNEELLVRYPELNVGTWYANGQTHIDTSVTIPLANKYAALGLARRYNQETIFNLKTLERTWTGGTGKGPGKLPSIEKRMEEIHRSSPPILAAKTGIVELQHWSSKEGLTEIDPARYGTGLKGTEVKRKIADPANWLDRSYYGVKNEGYVPEAGLGTHRYDVDISYKNLYDFNNDPLKLKKSTVKGTTVYRGGDAGIDVTRGSGKGISVTLNKKIAKTFLGPKQEIVGEATLPNTAKILKENSIPNNLYKDYMESAKKLATDALTISNIAFNKLQKTVIGKQQKIVDYARNNNYDAVEFLFENEIRIIKPSILKPITIKGNPISFYEKAIKEKGYKGYYVNSPTRGNVVALFDKATPKVKPVTGGKVIEFERKYSDNVLTKYIFEKTFDAVLEEFPAVKKAFATHKAKKLINTMRNLSDEANFHERSKMHKEIYTEINKLSKEEQAIIVPYLEGRAQLINEPSEQFKNFEHWYRSLIDKHETYLLKAGKISESRNILYQPLAKATGQTVEQVKAEMGTFTPVYVHHTFPQMFDAKMGIHFADTTGKRSKPGFFNKRYGVEGYSEDFKEILPKYTSEYIKFKHTEKFIADFTKKYGIRANLKDIKVVKGGLQLDDKLYAEYKILAPDGYLSYYRGKVDVQREILKGMENATFDEAAADVIAGMKIPTKEYVGVSKNKVVYLIPNKMMGELESFATPVFGSQKVQDIVRLVVDKPTQVWKDSVLAISPRWIKNNVMGDIIFNTFEGVGPLSYSRAFRTIYRDCIPDRLVEASFANVMKYNPKLGNTAKTAIGGYVQKIGASWGGKAWSSAIDTGYALNTMFEQPFVRALYIKLSREQAVKFLKAGKMKQTEANILARMRVIKGDELLCGPLVDKVHKTLPVFNLMGNFGRKYVRRFVPFVNWYKFMLMYGAKLPVTHPFKLVGARGHGVLAEEHREQVFKDYFPFMEREIENSGIPSRFNHMWPIGQPGDKMAKFFNVRGTNPFTTIEDFVELDFMNMASPIITVPVEQVTGRSTFGNRKFESGEAGITVTHKGVEYREFEKVRPPLVDHIMSQLPQYTLLKKWLVPARQWDTGTLLNPDPKLDPNTGEYVYPIESLEKILNMLGVDQKTVDIQKVWHQYQTRKAQALGRALSKHRECLSFEDIRGIMNELQADTKLWEQLRNEMDEKAYYNEEKSREFMEKLQQ